MTAIMAPQFLRAPSGAVSSKRTIVLLLLTFIVLSLLFSNYGADVEIPESIKQLHSDILGRKKDDDSKLLATIQNSTLGFQEILLLNLKARTDRRDGIALAASLTNLHLTFMEAVTEVSEKALPPNPPNDLNHTYSPAELGCWRSHLNAAFHMVQNNISTALIMEDDADWDIRIHDQMTDFARATRLLVQPLPKTTDSFLDQTAGPHGRDPEDQKPQTFNTGEHRVSLPTTSAYGDVDRWDMLWTGHCGASISDGSRNIPTGRAVVLNDQTIPEKQHIDYEFTDDSSFKDDYPHHTRIIFRSAGNTCTLSYALTLQGARKILYQMGIRRMYNNADGGLSAFCTGDDNQALPVCLTAQPSFFQHHRPAGNASFLTDISTPWANDIREVAETLNLRWSARVNLPKLVQGRTDFEDQYKDEDIE